jgi:sporulation protein YhbH
MSENQHGNGPGVRKETQWYGLFSRGARDWLRHNEKIREAVTQHLPDLVSDLDVSGSHHNRTVRVPVRFLEHYRFVLSQTRDSQGVGQGEAKPGDVMQTEPGKQGRRGKGEASGSGEGGPEFLLELKVDDIIDWFWEELNLPNLKAKTGTVEEDEYTREGWDRRGARARLDRRRTLKEAVKRRAVHRKEIPFIDEDLRYRQLVKHQRPNTEAVVFCCLDVSSSMIEDDRKLAKSFFFWALQGLRRQYRHIDTVFVAHTVEAWEFSEEEFFQVTAHGGTVASVAFRKVNELIDLRYSPDRYNIYLFYASDGENFPQDRDAALSSLQKLARRANFIGFLETLTGRLVDSPTSMSRLFKLLQLDGLPAGVYSLREQEDVWAAIGGFFRSQADTETSV